MLKKHPKFIIVGFPKSGTSFIRTNLSEHKNIWMPNFEPVHFSHDANANSLYRKEEDYTRIFKDIQDSDHIITGEKSSNYASSDIAIDKIYEYNKNIKIIISLRNPIDAVISYHNHNIRMGYETIIDLEEAILAQEKRSSSSYKIPYFAKQEKNRFQYFALFSYPTKIKMFLKKFGKQNVKIIFLDDIIENQQKTMDDIFEFLGVHSIIKKRSAVNKTHALIDHSKFKVKLFYIIHYAQRQSNNMHSKNYLFNNIVVRLVLKCFFKLCCSLIRHPYDQATKIEPIKPNSNAYHLLFNHFNSEIDELSIILNKDLSHWKNNDL
tara:strand:+ start:360 stop:1325 length:966 start_codon:yes stop_codon:yes gene_type:complete